MVMRSIATVLFICCQMLGSQSFWERTEPYFAVLNKMHFAGGDTIYGTLNSGFTRSTNNGSTWSSHIFVNYVQDIAVAPNGSIFLAQNSQKMSRSTNKGGSFTVIGTGINEPSCSSVLATSVGTLLAGTIKGIYRSTNNGDNWTKVAGPAELGADTTVSAFTRIGTTLYAATNSNVIYPSRSYLLTSTDDGVTWTKGSTSLDTVSVFKIVPMSNGTILARTVSGLRATANGGNSWSTITLHGQNVSDIAVASNGTIYTGAGNSNSTSIIKSTDNGSTWQTIETPFVGSGSLAVNAAGHIFIGREQMHRSTDGGATWKALPVSFPNSTSMKESPNGELFLTAGGSAYQTLFRSQDRGASWRALNTQVVGVPSVCFYGDTLIVADNYYPAKLFRSIDNGKSFNSINGISVLSGYVNALLATSYRSIIAATSNGIYRSVDHGKAWTKVSASPLTYLTQLPNGTMYGFRSFSGSGVMRSTDSGSTWIELKTGMGNTVVHSLDDAPNGDLYSGSDAGVFRSTNEGELWVRIDTQKVAKPYGIYVAVNKDGKVFMGGAKSGINAEAYQSVNNGATWSSINNNITAIDNQASMRFLFAASNGFLFTGTSSGLFKSAATTAAAPKISSNIPVAFSLEQNYPNPFNPSTVIAFSLAQSGKVLLTVYDVLGREVETLVNERLPAGRHEVRFNAARLSSSQYYYTLQSGTQIITKRMTLIK